MKPVMIPTTDVNSETATVTAWRVPDRSLVQVGEVVAEVETSKAVLDVVTHESGYLLRCAEEGEEVSLLEPLAHLFPTPEALEEHAASRAEAATHAAATSETVHATEPAIRRAAELGIDLESLASGALVTVKMVEAAAGNEATPPRRDLPLPLAAPREVERVAVIGAGLGATQVIDIFAHASTMQAQSSRPQQAVAIVDDDHNRWAGHVAGVPVVGGVQQLENFFVEGYFDAAIVSLGTSVSARTRLRELCGDLGIPLTNAIDPTARICSEVEFGTGNLVCAFCHFGVGTRVGDNNVFSAYNSFDHHNILGSDITTGPGCMTSGLVRIGDRVRLATGIFVEPHLEIGEDVQVASGAVIVASVAAGHAVKRRVVTMTTVPIQKRRSGHPSPSASTDTKFIADVDRSHLI
jgi:acetyltransferase-like isoleucine patch superfamily enzyme